jgi:Ni/Fe-hydrogenase 1 B-type cytochrome subunit
MSFYQIGDIRVELGDPVPFGVEKKREVVITAALGAPFGTTDPVDLALLSAASRKEDLRHYEQLSFTPLEPETGYSVAHVHKLETKQEEVIARGELETILAICHPDEAVRYRAELQSHLAMHHGYGALGIAKRSTSPGGATAWSLTGYIPIRATLEKSRRSEEPESFRYVRVWDWQLRVIHWFAVFLILLLSATGILMGESRFIYDGTGEHSSYFSYLRLIHFSAGWILVACAILRVAGLFLASNRFQRWDALFPVKPRDLKNLLQVAQNYLFCRFDRGPHYIGHNPLQQVAYTAIYSVGVAAILSGFALYALYAPDHWLFHYLIWFDNLIGVQRVRLIHLLIMYIFLAFIPIHVYLSIRADTVEREGAISSIISGGRWCRRGSKFEDG